MFAAVFIAAALASPPIPLDAAKRVFDDARIASDEDGGKLWGKTLYGPMVLADRQTRFYVRNDGTTGTLPADAIIANFATQLDGKLTTMIAWQSIEGGTSVQRRRLAMHECWHRIQKELGFPEATVDNAHLDTVDGRVWMQLELRALAAALRATGKERKDAIRDAMAFSSMRAHLFPGSFERERALENSEGLAEYTGVALSGMTAEEARLQIAREIEHVDPKFSFVRGFAYLTGPAYGLLLDEVRPGWTRTYKATDDLVVLLYGSNRVPELLRDARYGGAELRAAEKARDREQRERVARYRARLVDGPVLELPMIDAHFGFDPDAVVSLGDSGNVYPTFNASAKWGRIAVESGARIPGDWSKIVVAAEDRGKLELAPGCKVVAGKRKGDTRVTCE